MKWYRHIPNSLTLLNLLFGSFAIVLALSGELLVSSYFLMIAFHCDIFDGFAARLLKVTSPLGKELDSLADVVSFGLAPAVILYVLLLNKLGLQGFSFGLPFHQILMLLFPFLLPLAGALRLARFNIDQSQQGSFSGLPTPANALMALSIPVILDRQPGSFLAIAFDLPMFYVIYAITISALMLIPVRIYSLKPKNLSFSDNKIRIAFLLSAILILVLTRYTGLFLLVLLYYAFGAVAEGLSSRERA